MERIEKLLLILVELLEDRYTEFLSFEMSINELKQMVSPPRNMLDAVDLCKKLGIHRRTLDRYVRKFNIPIHRVCGRNFYDWDEVIQSLQQK